eukprot:scpid93323/ scgid4750/ 
MIFNSEETIKLETNLKHAFAIKPVVALHETQVYAMQRKNETMDLHFYPSQAGSGHAQRNLFSSVPVPACSSSFGRTADGSISSCHSSVLVVPCHVAVQLICQRAEQTIPISRDILDFQAFCLQLVSKADEFNIVLFQVVL